MTPARPPASRAADPAPVARTTVARTAVRAAAVALAVLVLGAVLVPPAPAARTITWAIADDAVLNGTHGDPEPIVARWRGAGITNVRLFAQWSHLAPAPAATRPPAGTDPRGPDPYDLTVLDHKIDLVRRHGMTVTLVLTGPGPVWGSREPRRRNGRWRPSPGLFGAFARQVARHTAGRVQDWIVWNEPNTATWLQPQNACVRGRCRPVAPHAYRALARAGYDAIRTADPTGRIAIGAISPKGDPVPRRTNGTTPPLVFLRELGCVDAAYRRRSSGDCRGFRPVRGDALAYHPHSNGFAPGYRSPRSGDARIGDLGRLTTVVDRLTAGGRLRVLGAHRFPLWLTEYGYETDPPERTRGVSLTEQSVWSQWGWWIAWNHPRVERLAQYEWMDEGAPGVVDPPGWQSGLHFADGRPKPIAQAFPNPIFAYRTPRAGTVWGQVRTATAPTTVRLERRTAAGWALVRTVVTDARGAFLTRVPRASRATYRYTYAAPDDGPPRASTSVRLRDR